METLTLPTGLVAKLHAVMAAVEAVPKNGWNDHHRYHYATEGDVMAAVKQTLIKEGLLLLAEQLPHRRDGNLTTVLQTFTWVDTETGEGISLDWAAEGSDPGDKGAYKAATGGLKFFLLKNLQIPTGDDPEAGEQTPRISADEMADRAVASGAATEATQRRAGQAGGGSRTATKRQQDLIRARADERGVSTPDLKAIVQDVAGEAVQKLDQLPQRLVDTVLERLAS